MFALAPAIGLAGDGLPTEESCEGNPGDPGTDGALYVDNHGALPGDELGRPFSGHLTIGSCDNQGLDGHVTAAGNADDGCGYIVADGDPTNGPDADGHMALQVDVNDPYEPVTTDEGEGDYEADCETA